jgi:fermentation-respiration switch protein FrsA (DUF1100 family)
VVVTLLAVSWLLTTAYTGLSIYLAMRLVSEDPRLPITETPAALGLEYRDVSFLSRDDHLLLRGWFIPGVLPNGHLTAARAIIMVHGHDANRADPDVGILDLSAALARNGFAVLAFDLRGHGQSEDALFSLGQFEQRDVLGAVDFLREGILPYPDLERPKAIGGWGVSLGATSLLLAAAQEPAIRAVVSDAAFADAIPILEQRIPKAGVPAFMTPGTLLAARAVYGIDFYHIRAVDVVASLAPRPIFFIHGAADSSTPPSDMAELVAAANTAPKAHVESWLVPGATHAHSFKVAGQEYITRLVSFFNSGLGSL